MLSTFQKQQNRGLCAETLKKRDFGRDKKVCKSVFTVRKRVFFYKKKKFDLPHSELRRSISRLQTCVHFFEKGSFFRQNRGFSGKFRDKKV